MTKKTIIGSLACLSVLAVSAVTAVTGGTAFKTVADTKWYHYDAVEATTKSVGSKEYWTDCKGNTVLTAPSGTVEEKGAPTQAFINKLPVDDERRVAQVGTIDFEQASDLNLVEFRDAKSVEIVEDSTATSGSHVLKVVAKGATENAAVVHGRMTKAFLDKVFADSKVQGIYFDVKASGNFNNFRRYTCNDSSLSANGATTYDVDWAGTSELESATRKTGLDTNWKTFYFERTFYNQIGTSFTGDLWTTFHAEQLAVDTTLYFDNIRISEHNVNNYYGFETGCARGVSANDWRVYGYRRTSSQDKRYPTQTGSFWGDVRFADSGTIDKVSFDYNIKSEGNRSLKIEKTSTSDSISMYLPYEYATNCPGDGYLLDVYFDENVNGVDVNASTGWLNAQVQLGNGIIESWKGNIKVNTWNTFFIPKANMTNVSGYFRALRFAGSQCNGTFYIDNLRPHLGVVGFEDQGYGISTQNVEVGLVNAPASQRQGGENLRDYNDHIFYINAAAAVSGSSSKEFASEGVSSLKYVHGSTNKNFNIYFNKTFFGEKMNDSGISIDIMSPDGKIVNFAGTQTVVGDGQWHTYTITKAEMNSLRASTHYCLAYNSQASAGTYYFDNLQFLA